MSNTIYALPNKHIWNKGQVSLVSDSPWFCYWLTMSSRRWLLSFWTEEGSLLGSSCRVDCPVKLWEPPSAKVACCIALTAAAICFCWWRVSCNGNRQTGHVFCFLNQTSMQERWKLCPHFGIIRSTSFSWYSPKHIAHLQEKTNQKALNFIETVI